MTDTIIRDAAPKDARLVARFISELATYERLAHEASPREEALRAHLAEDANPRLYGLIAEANGLPVGFAVYYFVYSTFETNWGLYLEDIYVDEKYRSYGIGRELFRRLGAVAKEKGCTRLDFNVLDWNVNAKAVYHKLGAVAHAGWTQMRFTGEALAKLADNKNPGGHGPKPGWWYSAHL